MTETIGNEMFSRMLGYNYGSQEKSDLMRICWQPTPWMVDVYDSPPGDDRKSRRQEIRHWCVEQFGPESWPIHDRPASWYSGSATVYGWTWYGFATEEMLNRFMEQFPDAVDRTKHV